MRKYVKKPTVIVIAVLAALAVAVAVLAMLNRSNAAAKQRLLADSEFLIIAGEDEHTVAMGEFLSLGQREIEAIYKKSGKDPETRAFTGVPFAEILRMKGIDLAGFRTVVFSAADGYASALPIADALDESSCFIVADGGGDGPFRMVMAKDQFSQRWCKLLTDVTLK